MYPNPVYEILTIEGIETVAVADVYNMNGQLVLSKKIVDAVGYINVDGLASGVYVIKLNLGQEILVERFSKK